MDGPVIIEVLDRHGRTTERVRVTAFPITVGRAYSADVIVDDPFVSPEHLRLSRDGDGVLIAEDLGSTNGVYRMTSATRATRIPIESDCSLRIGQTVVRFRSATHPVPPAVLHATASPWSRDGRVGSTAAASALGLALFVVINSYLGLYEKFSAVTLLRELLVVGVLFIVWCAIWALVCRVVSQRFRFLEYCSVAAMWGLVVASLNIFGDYVQFAFGTSQVAQALMWLAEAGVFAGLLYSHLRLCSASSHRRLAVRAVVVSAALVGLVGLHTYLNRFEFTPKLEYPAQLKAPAFNVLPGKKLDEFFSDAARLKARVDALAAES